MFSKFDLAGLAIVATLGGCTDQLEIAHKACVAEATHSYLESRVDGMTATANQVSSCMHASGYSTHGVQETCAANLGREAHWQFVASCYRPSGLFEGSWVALVQSLHISDSATEMSSSRRINRGE